MNWDLSVYEPSKSCSSSSRLFFESEDFLPLRFLRLELPNRFFFILPFCSRSIRISSLSFSSMRVWHSICKFFFSDCLFTDSRACTTEFNKLWSCVTASVNVLSGSNNLLFPFLPTIFVYLILSQARSNNGIPCSVPTCFLQTDSIGKS